MWGLFMLVQQVAGSYRNRYFKEQFLFPVQKPRKLYQTHFCCFSWCCYIPIIIVLADIVIQTHILPFIPIIIRHQSAQRYRKCANKSKGYSSHKVNSFSELHHLVQCILYGDARIYSHALQGTLHSSAGEKLLHFIYVRALRNGFWLQYCDCCCLLTQIYNNCAEKDLVVILWTILSSLGPPVGLCSYEEYSCHLTIKCSPKSVCNMQHWCTKYLQRQSLERYQEWSCLLAT